MKPILDWHRVGALMIVSTMISPRTVEGQANPPEAAAGETKAAAGAWIIRVDRTEVNVVFRVVDANGWPVEGLSAKQIRLLDEGWPAEITAFIGDVANSDVVLLADVSGSMSSVLERLQGALGTFSDIVAGDNKEAGGVVLTLVPFADTAAPLIDRTSNPARFKEAVRRLRPMGSTALIDAMLGCIQNAFGPPAQQRRSRPRFLVVVTDAGENSSSHTWAEVAKAALANEVVIQSVYIHSGTSDSKPSELANVASQSGGKSYSATARDLESVYATIAKGIRSYYQLTFHTDSTRIQNSHRWRRIAISVPGRPDLRISARSGYCPKVPCQTDIGTFVGPRLKNSELAAATEDDVPTLTDRFAAVEFEYTRDTQRIVETLLKTPMLVEKAWRIGPGGRVSPAGYGIRTGHDADIDAEACGLRAIVDPNPASQYLGTAPTNRSTQPRLAIVNPMIRMVGKVGGSVQDDYFQSQTILDLKDVSGRIPYRIEVRCNRPNYMISQDLLDFAINAIEHALRVKRVDTPRAK